MMFKVSEENGVKVGEGNGAIFFNVGELKILPSYYDKVQGEWRIWLQAIIIMFKVSKPNYNKISHWCSR